MVESVKSQKRMRELARKVSGAPKPKKKAFPGGYIPPKVESFARTGAGQKVNLAYNERRMKAALKAQRKINVKKK